MTVKVYGNAEKVQSTIISGGGTPNAMLKEWFDYAKGMLGNAAKVVDGIASLEVSDDSAVSLDAAMLAISEGYEVEGLPLMIEMTEAKYDNQVLAGVPNRVSVAEDGTETVLKWNEWKGSNMSHFQIGNKWYVPTNSNIAGGDYMKGSEFANIYGKVGYNLLTMEQYKALMPQVEA